MSSTEEKLANFLKSGQDWARVKTAIPGIFVVRMPAYKSSPARLAIEVNLVDQAGNPIKKRGLLIRNAQELEACRKIISQEKIDILVKAIEKLNPKPKSQEEFVEV